MQHFGDIMFKGAVAEEQVKRGTRAAYAKMTAQPAPEGLTTREASFIAARDSFYIASVSQDGWPYIQHRGGPAGFLKVVDKDQLAFGDYRGNKQYVSTGHFGRNDRASLFLMDYPNRRRLKILATATVQEADENPELAARLSTEGEGRVERLFTFKVEAFDWNCRQFITPRFTQDQILDMLGPQLSEFERVKEENAALKAEIETLKDGRAELGNHPLAK